MVASTHSLHDLGQVSQLASPNQQRSQLQRQLHSHHHHHHHATNKTTEDKRSRLSNVIANLRKKVPPQKDLFSQTSSVEKLYKMTVLNGALDNTDDAKGKKNSPEPLASLEAAEQKVPSTLDTAAPPVKLEERQEHYEEPRTLGDIILDRINNSHSEASVASTLGDQQLQEICKELLENILTAILLKSNVAAKNQVELLESKEKIVDDDGVAKQSLHCSLPLDKVASVLPANHQQEPDRPEEASLATTSEFEKTNSVKQSSTQQRYLCLYCDRKFQSISLRERHIERIHRPSSGRRSERTSRTAKKQHYCQYCSEQKVANLEGLFQHMVGSHSDRYYGCLQCFTRYLNKDALTAHLHDVHSKVIVQMEKLKEPVVNLVSETNKLEDNKQALTSNLSNAELDSLFYSNVICNIRENLLHHIDGKLYNNSTPKSQSNITLAASSPAVSSEHSSSNTPQYIQLPIDISLTAVAPVYTKNYHSTGPDDCENSSENAEQPEKNCSRVRPRRLSFEKYNFPRKYDGKEQWTNSIKDLSKFDISTQLTLRRKQKLAGLMSGFQSHNISRENINNGNENLVQKFEDPTHIKQVFMDTNTDVFKEIFVPSEFDVLKHDKNSESDQGDNTNLSNVTICSLNRKTEIEKTIFSSEFENFLKLKRKNNCIKTNESQSPYAELTGEWSRPRIYICGACAEKYVTLKELEEHKQLAHPNVWCMHYEFSGDQRELHKHLVFLPQRSDSPSAAMQIRTRQQTMLTEKICTKCAKQCSSLAELHRHMLECGGDQVWLLGLFGNGKKKSKWRPFGSRSRRRRQRGMKRNIQNSQTSKLPLPPREKPQYTGPRVRPSDRESIQKMLANLPPKRVTRKVLQENAARSQSRLRNARTTTDSASRISRSKAVLRNKLLKNAKSFQRKKNLSKEKKIIYDDKEIQPRAKSTRLRFVATKKTSLVPTKINLRLRRNVSTDMISSNDDSSNIVPVNLKRKKGNQRILSDTQNGLSKLKNRENDKIIKTPLLRTLESKSLKIKRSNDDPTRLVTRSKLRAAAKLAWNEHTKSKRITRLLSVNDDSACILTVGAQKTNTRTSVNASEKEQTIVRGRRLKKDLIDVKSSDQTPLEIMTEIKTRSQKSSLSNVLGRKMRRSITHSSKMQNTITESAVLLIDKKENIGSKTRSISKTKFDLKSNNRVDRSNSEKNESIDKKISKRNLKHNSEKIVDTDITQVKVLLETVLSIKKEKIPLRKSLRNKDVDVKDTFELNNKSKSCTLDNADSIITEPKEASEAENNDKNVVENDILAKKVIPVKRRGRLKRSIDNVVEPKPAVEAPVTTKRIENIELSDAADATTAEETNISIMDSNPEIIMKKNVAKLTIEHMKEELLNSHIDSGKENSTDDLLKSKFARPKKLKNLRGKNTVGAKRSLKNVIGILTDGVNVSVEKQDDTVVLTVQTSHIVEGSNVTTDYQNSETSTAEKISGECAGIISENCDLTASVVIKKDENKQNDSEVMNVSEQNSKAFVDDSKCPEKNTVQIEKSSLQQNSETNSFENINPSNDIILDLSRRKPKGKGSFLEKIVSKIAKKKDFSFDGDSSCSLDYSLGKSLNMGQECNSTKIHQDITIESLFTRDTTITLDNSTMISKSVNILKNGSIQNDVEEESTINSNTQPQVTDKMFQDASDATKATETYNPVGVKINQTIKQDSASLNKSIASEVSDDKFKDDSKITLNNTVTDIESNKKLGDTSIRDSEKIEICELGEKITKRSFKKGSSKVTNMKLSNKKSILDEENRDEICLADIMKMIESPKPNEATTEFNVIEENMKPDIINKINDNKDLIIQEASIAINDNQQINQNSKVPKSRRKGAAQKKRNQQIYLEPVYNNDGNIIPNDSEILEDAVTQKAPSYNSDQTVKEINIIWAESKSNILTENIVSKSEEMTSTEKNEKVLINNLDKTSNTQNYECEKFEQSFEKDSSIQSTEILKKNEINTNQKLEKVSFTNDFGSAPENLENIESLKLFTSPINTTIKTMIANNCISKDVTEQYSGSAYIHCKSKEKTFNIDVPLDANHQSSIMCTINFPDHDSAGEDARLDIFDSKHDNSIVTISEEVNNSKRMKNLNNISVNRNIELKKSICNTNEINSSDISEINCSGKRLSQRNAGEAVNNFSLGLSDEQAPVVKENLLRVSKRKSRKSTELKDSVNKNGNTVNYALEIAESKESKIKTHKINLSQKSNAYKPAIKDDNKQIDNEKVVLLTTDAYSGEMKIATTSGDKICNLKLVQINTTTSSVNKIDVKKSNKIEPEVTNASIDADNMYNEFMINDISLEKNPLPSTTDSTEQKEKVNSPIQCEISNAAQPNDLIKLSKTETVIENISVVKKNKIIVDTKNTPSNKINLNEKLIENILQENQKKTVKRNALSRKSKINDIIPSNKNCQFSETYPEINLALIQKSSTECIWDQQKDAETMKRDKRKGKLKNNLDQNVDCRSLIENCTELINNKEDNFAKDLSKLNESRLEKTLIKETLNLNAESNSNPYNFNDDKITSKEKDKIPDKNLSNQNNIINTIENENISFLVNYPSSKEKEIISSEIFTFTASSTNVLSKDFSDKHYKSNEKRERSRRKSKKCGINEEEYFENEEKLLDDGEKIIEKSSKNIPGVVNEIDRKNKPKSLAKQSINLKDEHLKTTKENLVPGTPDNFDDVISSNEDDSKKILADGTINQKKEQVKTDKICIFYDSNSIQSSCSQKNVQSIYSVVTSGEFIKEHNNTNIANKELILIPKKNNREIISMNVDEVLNNHKTMRVEESILIETANGNPDSTIEKSKKKRNLNKKSKLLDEHVELQADNNDVGDRESKVSEKIVVDETVKENIPEIPDILKNRQESNVYEKNESLLDDPFKLCIDHEKFPKDFSNKETDQKINCRNKQQLDFHKKPEDFTSEKLQIITDDCATVDSQLSCQDQISKKISLTTALEIDALVGLDVSSATKKRPSGNFSVVTKSGKILIVEKKKKLTKETAKFFCDVCSTSFTRKSSLKKHNLSQSHVLQLTMNCSDKTFANEDTIKPITNDILKIDPVIRKTKSYEDDHSIDDPQTELISFAETASSTALTISKVRLPLKSPEEELEDEMLDEEICKITENMSHDEYVLTDHVSPLAPNANSTPLKEQINQSLKSMPSKQQKKEKKRKNLADEHLSLNTPIHIQSSSEEEKKSHTDNTVTTRSDKLLQTSVSNEIINRNKMEQKKVVESNLLLTEVRRTSRIKNQHINHNSSENVRPKRNQLRPSYKEDEDFDTIESPTNQFTDNIEHRKKAKKGRSNESVEEYEQSEIEIDDQKNVKMDSNHLQIEPENIDKKAVSTKKIQIKKKCKTMKLGKEIGRLEKIENITEEKILVENQCIENSRIQETTIADTAPKKKFDKKEVQNLLQQAAIHNTLSESELDQEKNLTSDSVGANKTSSKIQRNKSKKKRKSFDSTEDNDKHTESNESIVYESNASKEEESEISISTNTIEPTEISTKLVFPKLVGESSNGDRNNLKSSILTGFESDENSLDTNMSVDIQKLLDDPEMTSELITKEESDEDTRVSNFDKCKNPMSTETVKEKEEYIQEHGKRLNKERKKITKLTNKKVKSKTDHKSDASDREECGKEDLRERRKNKIVKSVFGRALAGEKVKEVLDDWQSKSENNSSDSEYEIPLRLRGRIKLRNASKKINTSENDVASRQSKRRAEELISRAFNDDSPIVDVDRGVINQKLKRDHFTLKENIHSEHKIENVKLKQSRRKSGSKHEENEIKVQNSNNNSIDTCSSFSQEEIGRRRKKSLKALDNEITSVLTIAPTDAAEDNAQDLDVNEMPSRPPTKVLNFDEELFVECCSRLKATSEKELRGAKKIKLDHTSEHSTSTSGHQNHHHRKDEHLSSYRRDRWKEVESQNSLGSLLESVNQLLGEDYNDNDDLNHMSKRNHHRTHHHRHLHHRKRTPSPEENLVHDENEQLGYDDSLDVAFEHNNKLRNKIQQRMRESENLIATSFGHKQDDEYKDEHHELESKIKVNNGLGGILDKALSNLLHHNEKHDHNESAPMKILAELACARVPSTPSVPEKEVEADSDSKINENSGKTSNSSPSNAKNSKSSIKDLFERKIELCDKKHFERVKLIKLPDKSRRPKKNIAKVGHHNLPLIRTSQFRGGMVERKKRRDDGSKKNDLSQTKTIKDVYDFDDEESTSDTGFTSFRGASKEINMSALLSKTIGDTLANGKSISAIGESLENMLDRKFKDVDKSSKIKNESKYSEIKSPQKSVLGPMDEFIERRQKKRNSNDHNAFKRHSSKSGKRKGGKMGKKKSRNAWYENDSSDEFVTKLKAEDIGVGISKSQRTCSKGKQNLFAEMSSTSSESDFNHTEEDKEEYEADTDINVVKTTKSDAMNKEKKTKDDSALLKEHSHIPEIDTDEWRVRHSKKSESELSDHPLMIDEKPKDLNESEHHSNSDVETEERALELDDLYREDSSVINSDNEDLENQTSIIIPEDKSSKHENYISVEDALDLLDQSHQFQELEPKKIKNKQNSRKEFTKKQSKKSEVLPEKQLNSENVSVENLPLHVFLSRKVQESKKRKEEQQVKQERIREEQERLFVDLQPSRRQRKCAIGKQGLLAEISSSDDETDHELQRSHNSKQRLQRENKEKRKERYIEKKHEQMIAKEQKAIEEAIMRELEKKRQSATSEASGTDEKDDKKRIKEQTVKENGKANLIMKQIKPKFNDIQGNRQVSVKKRKTPAKSPKSKAPKPFKNQVTKDIPLEDEISTKKIQIKTGQSRAHFDNSVGVAIGRRKRAAVNQLYYWSSSSDEDESDTPISTTITNASIAESVLEDERPEQHGWIVGDSHKRMITMLAMEKQMKEKRRRSENEEQPINLSENKESVVSTSNRTPASISAKLKTKKHRNSTS